MSDRLQHFTEWHSEHTIGPDCRDQIVALLQRCFPGVYPARDYYKQVPYARCLAWDGAALVGHVAVEYRAICVGGEAMRILGVMDLCVEPTRQGAGLASQLLQRVEGEATEHGVEFLLLFADDHRVYKRAGFRSAGNPCRWYAIDEHRSLDVREGTLADCLMVKSLSGRPWPEEGALDMLGTVF